MATYYIHPISGSDENAGTALLQPWKGFGPLRAVRLQPGDQVEVVAPGKLTETVSISGDGTAEAPIEIHFAPGRYHMHPGGMLKRTYDISNTNDGRDIPKAICLLVDKSSHIRVTGPEATILCRGKMIEICVDASKHVTIDGLTFDYHRPTVSEWAVDAVTADTADLTIHPDSAYKVEDGKITWCGEGWQYETGLAQELIPETDEVWRRKDPLLGLRIEEMAPRMLRAHGSHDMTAGHVFQLRDTFRDCVGVFLHRSRDLVLKDLRLAFMHGMGVLCQFTENITLDGVKIEPEAASGRTTAAWADCVHMSGCRGKMTIRDCIFCGAHDDAINIHGTHLRITEQVGERQIIVRFMHRQTFGFQAFYPGDDIDYVHADRLAPYASTRVSGVEMLSPREQRLTLEDPVPTERREHDVIENVTWTPEVEITGCTARRIPTRGYLITTRRRVRVEGNTFAGLRNGIHVESDAEGWFESGCVRDMTIRKNRFLMCKAAAIRLSPHNSAPNSAVHQNIEISDNTFVLRNGLPAVEARSTAALRITDNRMQTPKAADPESLIIIQDCKDVTISDNSNTVFESETPADASTPPPPRHLDRPCPFP